MDISSGFEFGTILNDFWSFQSELSRFQLHSLSSKILKFPEFNQNMG